MGKSEKIISKEIQLTAGSHKARLMRNNRGMFYTLAGQKVRAGLEADKSGDLIGWTQVKITPDMVGKTVAVYTEIEVKKEDWKKPTNQHEKDQATRLDTVSRFGGIAGFCNNKNNLKKVIDMWLHSL